MVRDNLPGDKHRRTTYTIRLIAFGMLMVMLVAVFAQAAEYGEDGTVWLYQDDQTAIKEAQGMTDGGNATLIRGQPLEAIYIELHVPKTMTVLGSPYMVLEYYLTLNITGEYEHDDDKECFNYQSYNTTYYTARWWYYDVGMVVDEGYYTFDFTLRFTMEPACPTATFTSDTPDCTIYVEGVHPGQDPVTYGDMIENTLGGIGALILIVGPGYLWYVSKHEGTILAMGMAMVVLMIGFTFFYVFLLGG